MNAIEQELQSLRRELDDFRNENTALYNELTKQNKTLCEEIISLRQENIEAHKQLSQHHIALNEVIKFFGGECSHDHLQKYLTRLAAMQTAEFIINNMPKLKTFDNRGLYIHHVLSFVDNPADEQLYLEFGVFKGESINFISENLPDKIVYGFDSFDGLPEDWWYGLQKGGFSVNGRLPDINSNVRLVKGWFNETLPAFVKAHPEKCAFVHVDCDLYSSTKTIFDVLKNQIGAGTVIAFDEYFNYPGWQTGEYKAFQEFIAETGLEFEYIARTNFTQVAVRIK